MSRRDRTPGKGEAPVRRDAAALGITRTCAEHGNAVLRLLRSYPPEAIWTADPDGLVAMKMNGLPAQRFVSARSAQPSPEDLARALDALGEAGLTFVYYGHPDFPPQLTELALPPAGLFFKGNVERLRLLLTRPCVTIVGTRRASTYGTRAAREFATAFAARGIVVVSGMALGIDGRCHEAALESGGPTVAVLGCGADVVYPQRHQRLYERIAQAGVVMSELPPGSPPAPWTFPNRNRLLAALGDAVLVIEGGVTSGAMQTAEQAAQIGRPVFAVPGSIYTDGHRGCNLLIRDGATPALDPAATVEEFLLQTRIERGGRTPPQPEGALAGPHQEPLEDLAAAGREALMEAMDDRPCSVDALVLRTGMVVRRLTVALAELELAGLVTRAGPGLYIRAP